MRLFNNDISKKSLPLVLASAVTAALTGCGGGGSDAVDTPEPTPQPEVSKVEVPIDSTFAALLMGRVDHNAQDGQSLDVDESQPTPAIGPEYYSASLTAVNTVTGEEQIFDWPLMVNEEGMTGSQKTVSIEPGIYNFSLSVDKGSSQYVAMLTEYVITDETEERLDMTLEPVIGDTIVDIIMSQAQLSLNYPTSELVSIDAPQIGVVIDGVEHVFAINTATGIADVLLNIPAGPRDYDIKLYNGDILIGRSSVGPQSTDILAGDTLKIDIIKLQADITVDVDGLEDSARIIFNIPQEVIDRVTDINDLNVHAKLVDANGEFYDDPLTVQQNSDGTYYAEYLLNHTPEDPLTADLSFLDSSSGTSESFASCTKVITVGAVNTMNCGVEQEYSFNGNLLATLSINVLDELKVAQSGAKVYVNGELQGITGSFFGTEGFLKVFVKPEESHLVRAEKDGLEDTKTLTPAALSINNFDLTLIDPVPTAATSCLAILNAGNSTGSGVYTLDVDGSGPLDSFDTFCDMETEIDGKAGGWTLVQNRENGVALETAYNLAGPVYYPTEFSGETMDVEQGISFSDMTSNDIGAISNDSWLALKSISSGIMLYAGGNDRLFYTRFDNIKGLEPDCKSWEEGSSNILNHTLFHVNAGGCVGGLGADVSLIGDARYSAPDRHAAVYARGDHIWEVVTWTESDYTSTAGGRKTAIFVR